MADRRKRLALDELLVRRATERLAPADAGRLALLLAEYPEIDGDAYERAAAAVWLAAAGAGSGEAAGARAGSETMPAGLAVRILARARPDRSSD